jgi:hypothetical protein
MKKLLMKLWNIAPAAEQTPVNRVLTTTQMSEPRLFESRYCDENMISLVVKVRDLHSTDPEDYRIASAYYDGEFFVVRNYGNGRLLNAAIDENRIINRSATYERNDITNRYLREIFIPNMEVKIKIEEI